MFNIAPHHVAGSLLLVGLTIGGYFGISALIPSSLENHLIALNLELESNWASKAQEYKKIENTNLISSIDKTKQDNDFENLLKKWCEKKKGKYFLGNDDPTYKNFSIWCTVNKNIGQVLSGRNLKELDTNVWIKKLTAYKADTNTDKFDSTTINSSEELKALCERQKTTNNYLYENHPTLNKILKWCYFD